MAVCVWNVKPAPIPNAPLPNRASRVKALSPRSDVAGVVLAGGLGRRMGRDKTGLRLREGEADFISRAAALLARVVVDVRVGCRADQAERAARAGRPLTPDLTPGGGVLCAVQSCLRHLERPCLVIPCDMPFLTEGVLLALLAARDEGLAAGCPPGVTLFRRAETGRLEPMVAVYEPAGLPFLDAASARGDYGLFRALPPERRIYLDYDEKDDWMFYNVNTPADLEAARRARLP
ncbi:MAG: molybdenum cofactor guanylyltransferase [Desulfovibrionaceae bacterium]|nr:MAG: molybdenum cofactor guanylyltransferase [Desulfovibrionaceae bacterium]